MMEARLVLGFDGTALDNKVLPLSNCAKIDACLEDIDMSPTGDVQKHIYYSGIGTTESTYLARALSKATGHGAHERLFDAYINICDFAAENEDSKIVVPLHAFSRGCSIALVLEKFVHKVGLFDFAKTAEERGVEELSYAEKRKIVESELYMAQYTSDSKPSSPEMQAFREQNSLPVMPEFHLFFFDPVSVFRKISKYDPFNRVHEEELELHGSKLPRSTKSYTVIFAKDEPRVWYAPIQLTFPDHYEIDYDGICREGVHCDIGGGFEENERWADRSGLDMLAFMQRKAGVAMDMDIVEELFDPSERPIKEPSALGKLMKGSKKEGYLLGAVTEMMSPGRQREISKHLISDDPDILGFDFRL